MKYSMKRIPADSPEAHCAECGTLLVNTSNGCLCPTWAHGGLKPFRIARVAKKIKWPLERRAALPKAQKICWLAAATYQVENVPGLWYTVGCKTYGIDETMPENRIHADIHGRPHVLERNVKLEVAVKELLKSV